jgi:hypothetical protein
MSRKKFQSFLIDIVDTSSFTTRYGKKNPWEPVMRGTFARRPGEKAGLS